MLKFFTFAVDINKYRLNSLNKIINLLINSLENTNPNFHLIVYTNYNLKINSEKIEIREYYDGKIKYYSSSNHKLVNYKYALDWRNLSFNKINLWKDLYNETKENYIWIDLDTIIVNDISYLNSIPNFFIINGAKSIKPNPLFFSDSGDFITNSLTIPRKDYIQGNFWKLDINLYKEMINCYFDLRKRDLTLRYDLQDLFNYYVYIFNKEISLEKQKIFILGRNIARNTENGLGVFNESGLGHPNASNIHSLNYDNSGNLRSKYLPEKKIDIISFVMKEEIKLLNNLKFNSLFPSSRNYIVDSYFYDIKNYLIDIWIIFKRIFYFFKKSKNYLLRNFRTYIKLIFKKIFHK